MFYSLIGFSIFLFVPSNSQVPKQIHYGKTHYGGTNGSLVPDVYELIRDNNTKPFAVRVRFDVVKGRCYPSINLLCTRNTSMLASVLPRTQTLEDSTSEYYHLSDTLCDVEKHNKTFEDFNGTVRLSVSSGVPTNYSFSVYRVYHHFLNISQPSTIILSPPEPEFYKFYFPENVDLITVRVTSPNNVCGKLTIQKAQCPVFNNEGQVSLNEHYAHQTISRRGFLKISRDQFGDRIHIIFSVLPNDDLCHTDPYYPGVNAPDRVKQYVVLVSAAKSNFTSIYIIGSCFGFIIVVVAIGAWYANRGNCNERRQQTENHFHEMSLSHCLIFIPMAGTVVLAKYWNTGFPFDTDTCNINFMCAVNFFQFISFNSILSAFSIAVVGIINFGCTWAFMWSENFMINVNIILTGVLWAVMNTCPQTDTFQLYTFAMVMLVLQAKVLLFQVRNGMHVWHQTYIGSYTMFTMLILMFDGTTNSKLSYVLCRIAVCHNAFGFTAFFVHRYWKDLEPIFIAPVIPTDTSSPLADQEDTSDELPLIHSEDSLIPTTSTHALTTSAADQESSTHRPRNETEISDHMKTYVYINESKHETRKPTDQKLQQIYSVLAFVLVLFWTMVIPFFFPFFNSTLVVLRLIQSDFLLYFLYYCLNKFKYENELGTWSELKKLRKFGVFTVCFVFAVISWGYISQFKLPAYVPYSPAESRNLNQECIIDDITGTDWHDILHYCTALICFLYPAMVKCIDMNIEAREILTQF